jgi:hypothetical protein
MRVWRKESDQSRRSFLNLNYKLKFCQFSVQVFSTASQLHNLGFTCSCGCVCFSESSVCVIKLMFFSLWMSVFQKDFLKIRNLMCAAGGWVGAVFHGNN